MTSYRKALDVLGQPGIDLNAPSCCSAASGALYGFAAAALKLELRDELFEVLARWRPHSQLWANETTYPEEGEWLAWVESVYQYLVRTRSL
jgi:hypothetical protein